MAIVRDFYRGKLVMTLPYEYGIEALDLEAAVYPKMRDVLVLCRDATVMMQRGRSHKRVRSPTPRRRRAPARPAQPSGRTRHPVPARLHQRARWIHNPSRPSSTSTWRCRRENRGHRQEEAEPGTREEVNLTGEARGSDEHPVPPLDNGTRTWGELTGLLDPMDELGQLIAPVVLENSVERIGLMSAEERGQLAVNLVRFLALFFTEILRMLNMAEMGDHTSLMQTVRRNVTRKPRGPREHTMGVDEAVLMQTMVDQFGVLLQRLLGKMEKLSPVRAAARASFMLSMLRDIQRPGPHVHRGVLERMDRLQALLLSFEDAGSEEVLEDDREWCMEQWQPLQVELLSSVKPKAGQTETEQVAQQATSSTDIMHLEDSQLGEEEEGASQVAVLANGTTRPLTTEELEEIAYHEELERQAAEAEVRADEQRWLEFKAQKLREEEEATLTEAMDVDATPPHKKARVRVQIEGAYGRVVKSEVFDMVVGDDEALTYKIEVLPKNDPEVESLRRLQARRERSGEEDAMSEVSPASADTVAADEMGKVIPPPVQASEEELCRFMDTKEGLDYYEKWLKGEITSKMVRERSGTGLLAKFCGKKADDEEDQKMLAAALKAEQGQGSDATGNAGPSCAGGEGEEGQEGSMPGSSVVQGTGLEHRDHGSSNSGNGSSSREREAPGDDSSKRAKVTAGEVATMGELRPPSSWPSFSLLPCSQTIYLDTQDSPQQEHGTSSFDERMNLAERMSEEAYNRYQLDMVMAAGDVPSQMESTAVVSQEEHVNPGSLIAEPHLLAAQSVSEENEGRTGEGAAGDAEFDPPGRGGDADETGGGAASTDDLASSAASAATRRSRMSVTTESAEGGHKQTDLKGWIK